MNLKNQVVLEFSKILGEENVIHTEEQIMAADPILLCKFEKAYDYKPEHMALCIAKVHTAKEVSEVLKYCNDNDRSYSRYADKNQKCQYCRSRNC